MPTRVRTISYGGGVQSTALVVLAAQGVIDFPVALFANTGDDSEHPATLAYVRDVAMPWAAENGIEVHELHKVKGDGTTTTLWEHLHKNDSRSVPIPVRMSNGAPGSRSCTVDFKINVVAKWLKANGATADAPATVAIGISTDEIQRVNFRTDFAYQQKAFPLIDLGINRSDCEQIIRGVGLPVPPKSACFFCPFHRPSEWQRLAIEEPGLFAQSVKLERTLNERRETRGQDPVWLTRFNKPLDEVVNDSQLALFPSGGIGEAGCDEGVCFV